MRLREKSVLMLATGCFIGFIPFAPGSFGTLAGIPISYLLTTIDFKIALICIVLFIGFACIISGSAERILKKNDPGPVVIDEIAGMMVALAGLPFQIPVVVGGFIVFRVLDIFKPFPINQAERKLSGGIGIVMDDVVAGMITNGILRGFIFIVSIYR